jgi:GNAT superfamily N-acetyltransferase
MNYELQPALWEDNAFLEELFGDVRAADFASLDLSETDLAQLLALKRVLLNETEAEVRLVDIALLKPFRGAGVGTSIVQQLQAHADAQGLPLRLSVKAQNPARRLFERLGFVASRDGELTINMEWTWPAD